MQHAETIQFEPIGIVHSCYKEKFGIPRQSGLVKEAPATLELFPEFAKEEAVRELDGFSHIWLIFLFHQQKKEGWIPMVRPPRLGGNKKVGVFASRAPVRPNPIGLSVVELDRIEADSGKVLLHLKGIDILDQTPILDIKPYIPYSDSIESAKGGFATGAPETNIEVNFSVKAFSVLEKNKAEIPDLETIITQMLTNDPRPAYRPEKNTDKDKIYGAKLFHYDVRWKVDGTVATVIEIKTGVGF